MNPKNESAVKTAQLRKQNILNEQRCTNHWSEQWGWLVEEYEKLRMELKEVSRQTLETPTTDYRNVKPLPNSTNHEYGWLASNPEFNLLIFGKENQKMRPILEEHRLIFGEGR